MARLVSALVLLAATAAQAADPAFDRARLADWIGPTDKDAGELNPSAIEVSGERGAIRFVVGGERCALLVFPVPQAGPGDMSAKSVGLRREGEAASPCGELVSRAINRIQAHDHDTPPAAIPRPPIDVLLLGALLVALLIPSLGRALWALRGGEWTVFLAAFLVALGLRALAPHHLVMVYFGYKHVGEAVDLASLPRYGPGATLLWWALLRFVSPDHAAVQWLHCVLGAATVGLWGAWTERVLSSRRAALLVAALLAFAPLLVRDHASESMAVGAMLALSAAAFLALDLLPLLVPGAVTGQSTSGASAARGSPVASSAPSSAPSPLRSLTPRLGALVALCLFAASCRPDIALVTLPVLLATALAAFPPRVVLRALTRAWPFFLVGGLLSLPLIRYAMAARRADLESGNLPRLDHFFGLLSHNLRAENVLLQLSAYPVGVWLLVLAAAILPGTRRALWLVGAAFIAIVPTFIDFNETSNLRLQAPAAVLFTVAAGFGWVALVRLGQARGGPLRWAAPVCVILAFASMIPSVSPLLRARNPDVEEQLIRESLAAIEKERQADTSHTPAILARLDYPDITVRDVHLYFPDYLFAARGIPTAPLKNFGHHLDGSRALRAYYFQGVRCYDWPAWEEGSAGLQPGCRDICQQFRCDPVFERDQPNLHDWPTFDGYHKLGTLRVGLYRLFPK